MTLGTPFIIGLTSLLSYLLGSISFSFLFGRILRRDLRTAGSGNLGAVNAGRVLGPAAGILVFALDMGKGFLAAWLSQKISHDQTAVFAACIAVMLGHNYSIFLRFTGGKGIATAGGLLLVLSPKTFIGELVIGGITYLFHHDIHESALAMIFSLPVALGLFTFSWRFFMLGLVISTLSALRHKREVRQLFGKLN